MSVEITNIGVEESAYQATLQAEVDLGPHASSAICYFKWTDDSAFQEDPENFEGNLNLTEEQLLTSNGEFVDTIEGLSPETTYYFAPVVIGQ